MARFDLNQRFYKIVPGNTIDTDDYVPANGEDLFMVNLGVSSSQLPDTVSSIVWDADGIEPEVLLSSYSEAIHKDVNLTLQGDGSKILRISLSNDLNEPAHMGAFFQAVQL